MWAKLIKKFYFTNKVRQKVAEFNVFYECWQIFHFLPVLPTIPFFRILGTYPKDLS